MRPTLRQLEYAVTIADTRRFGEAAKLLNVSQPSLSAQIAEMEFHLATTLFERGRHGAILTPAGETIVSRARLILREMEELKAAARQMGDGLVGRVHLGVLPSIGPYLLPETTKQLHAQFPELKLFVREQRTIDLEEDLEAGKLDIIISTPDDHPGKTSLHLFDEEIWVCVAPDDPLAKGTGPIGLKDLKDRSLLRLGAGHRLSDIVSEIARQSGAGIMSGYEGTSLDAIRQMAAMGTGVAILPSLYALTEARRDNDLIVRKVDHEMARRTVSVIWRPQSPFAENFKTIGETLKATAARLMSETAS